MRASGFTFVEILIVVLILGILAMIAAPEFTSAVQDTKESTALQNQQMVQKQIGLYKLEHNGRSPHLDENGVADTNNFVPRLTGRSDPSGGLNPSGTCGPYLTSWPANPLADPPRAADVQFGTLRSGSGTTGWYFNTETHKFIANDAISIEKQAAEISSQVTPSGG